MRSHRLFFEHLFVESSLLVAKCCISDKFASGMFFLWRILMDVMIFLYTFALSFEITTWNE